MDRTANGIHDDAPPRSNPLSKLQRTVAYVRDQISQVHPTLIVARILLLPLPRFTFGQVRAAVLRSIGFKIGSKSGFYDMPKIFGRGAFQKQLQVGRACWINIGCHFDLSAPIVIGNGVGIGPEVMLMTGTHEMGPENNRTGHYIALPVTIDDGVWIGARCTIMPGVTIGKGSVIATGTTVTRDVPPNTILNGTRGMPIEKWLALTKLGTEAP